MNIQERLESTPGVHEHEKYLTDFDRVILEDFYQSPRKSDPLCIEEVLEVHSCILPSICGDDEVNVNIRTRALNYWKIVNEALCGDRSDIESLIEADLLVRDYIRSRKG